ncbi:potassium channel family protein [Streptomyces sp. NPDC058220]|uniref:potassium channel family protein n=1 Tax=unclassified Streptomyces TaxID=2593676 RepID=UPI003664A887
MAERPLPTEGPPMPPLSLVYLLRRLLGNDRWQRLHVRAAVWATLAVVVVLLAGSWAIVPFEVSAPHATITSFPLALWWSVETATTVGYGDLYPVTAPGRVIATVVMLAGISVFSIVTASIATWFVGGAARDARRLALAFEHAEREGKAGASDEMRAVHDRFDRLEHLIKNPGGPPAQN